jgi:hypothetical protein
MAGSQIGIRAMTTVGAAAGFPCCHATTQTQRHSHRMLPDQHGPNLYWHRQRTSQQSVALRFSSAS